MKTRSGERTLLASVLLSSPGPLVVGLGLLLGRSSTQLADFIRRSVELIAILASWLVFKALHGKVVPDPTRKARLEWIANDAVGAAMCLSGLAMLIIALFSVRTDRGNVLAGLAIAILGVTTNTWFWLRYRKLDRDRPDVILGAQRKLYRAKSLVDGCVVASYLLVIGSKLIKEGKIGAMT